MKWIRTGTSLIAGSLFFAATAVAETDTFYVTVRDAKLRSRAEFWSASTGDLAYGDRLSVVSSSGDWIRVKDPRGHEGFVHHSAVTDRKVVLNAGAKFTEGQTAQNDVVLAGKGFNAEVEKKYAAGNRGANFSAVNAMEQRRVSQRELADFIAGGQLGKKEG